MEESFSYQFVLGVQVLLLVEVVPPLVWWGKGGDVSVVRNVLSLIFLGRAVDVVSRERALSVVSVGLLPPLGCIFSVLSCLFVFVVSGEVC